MAAESEVVNGLISKIEKDVCVAVVGLGYVGLPFVELCLRKGCRVIGVEIQEEKIQKICSKITVVPDVPAEKLNHHLETGAFLPTSDMSKVNDADVIVICVPTPLGKNKEPNLKPVQEAMSQVLPFLRAGQLLSLESTVYPGLTRELISEKIKEKGFTIGKDFFVGYSPERIDPGNTKYTLETTPKIFSGMTENCRRVMRAFYGKVIQKLHEVSSPKVAEMAKLLENIFRNVNIALVNELMVLSNRLGIDIWEVIEAAGTKPFGFMKFQPGPGVGGHCIPIDPFYLSWKAREVDFYSNFVQLAAEVNENIPYYVLERSIEFVNQKLNLSFTNASILVMGVSFKPDIDDCRSSSAVKLMELIGKRSQKISFYDPFVPVFHVGKKEFSSVNWEDSDADCMILHTEHSEFPYQKIVDKFPLIIDTRNAFGKRGIVSEKIVKI